MPRAPEPADPLKRTRNSFRSMWSRCTNPNHVSWPYYGGKGIAICERWRSFDAFVADLGLRPAGTTLDRKDSRNNYEPGNVRWADKFVQSRQQVGWNYDLDRLKAFRAKKDKRFHEDAIERNLNKWDRFGTLYTLGDDRHMANDVLAALEEEFGTLPPVQYEGLTVAADPQPVLFYPPGDEVTLEDIASEFKCTREYVRQVEESALGKLQVLFEQLESGKPLRVPHTQAARNIHRETIGRTAVVRSPRKAA